MESFYALCLDGGLKPIGRFETWEEADTAAGASKMEAMWIVCHEDLRQWVDAFNKEESCG